MNKIANLRTFNNLLSLHIIPQFLKQVNVQKHQFYNETLLVCMQGFLCSYHFDRILYALHTIPAIHFRLVRDERIKRK